MQIRDFSSKMQQIACKSEILAPKCSKYQGQLPQTEKQRKQKKNKTFLKKIITLFFLTLLAPSCFSFLSILNTMYYFCFFFDPYLFFF